MRFASNTIQYQQVYLWTQWIHKWRKLDILGTILLYKIHEKNIFKFGNAITTIK